MRLGWMILVLCAACDPVDTAVDADPVLPDMLCDWVRPVTSQVDCVVTIAQEPSPGIEGSTVVIEYSDLGFETSYALNGSVLSAAQFDERGRTQVEEVASASIPGTLSVTNYSWDGCDGYEIERDADGDEEVDEVSQVQLHASGAVQTRTTTRLTGSLAGQVREYTSEWEGDRLSSSRSTSDGDVVLSLVYTYGSDDRGEFVDVAFFRGNADTPYARSVSWTDSLGRDVYSEGYGADGELLRSRSTVYDGDGIDSDSALLIDDDADGAVDSTVTTQFLPDGRILSDQTANAQGTTERRFAWDCPGE